MPPQARALLPMQRRPRKYRDHTRQRRYRLQGFFILAPATRALLPMPVWSLCDVVVVDVVSLDVGGLDVVVRVVRSCRRPWHSLRRS